MIVVGTTIAPYKMGGPEGFWSSWLHNARQLREYAAVEANQRLQFFAAIEVDGRGLAPFHPLVDRLVEVGRDFDFWTFSVDDQSTEVNSSNRLKRICTGRNLITDYAVETGASHILFLDADTMPAPRTIPQLLELGYPIVGGHVPTYCLDGPRLELPDHPEWDVRQHWNTAGYLLVSRDLFRFLRWRVDPDVGQTDDPCYDRDARIAGWPTLVRHDVVGAHFPTNIPPMEQRGHDRRYHR